MRAPREGGGRPPPRRAGGGGAGAGGGAGRRAGVGGRGRRHASRRSRRGAVDARGHLRGVQAGGGADLHSRQAEGKRLECVRDRAHIGYATQQSLQEDRALRTGSGGVVADIEKDRDWGKEMGEGGRLLKKPAAGDPTPGRPSGGGRDPPPAGAG